jgi:hypothetical protein
MQGPRITETAGLGKGKVVSFLLNQHHFHIAERSLSMIKILPPVVGRKMTALTRSP